MVTLFGLHRRWLQRSTWCGAVFPPPSPRCVREASETVITACVSVINYSADDSDRGCPVMEALHHCSAQGLLCTITTRSGRHPPPHGETNVQRYPRFPFSKTTLIYKVKRKEKPKHPNFSTSKKAVSVALGFDCVSRNAFLAGGQWRWWILWRQLLCVHPKHASHRRLYVHEGSPLRGPSCPLPLRDIHNECPSQSPVTMLCVGGEWEI